MRTQVNLYTDYLGLGTGFTLCSYVDTYAYKCTDQVDRYISHTVYANILQYLETL